MILPALALMAAITVAFVVATRSQGDTATAVGLPATILGQANLVRQQVNNCTFDYPAGGYPATPGSTFAKDLLCPGAPIGNQALWAGSTVLMPAAPLKMTDWTYTNDSQGIRLAIATNNKVYATDPMASLLDATRKRFEINGASCVRTATVITLTIWLTRTGSAPATQTC
jgi:hypothetical protein